MTLRECTTDSALTSCPDGSCVLVAADDRSLSLFRLYVLPTSVPRSLLIHRSLQSTTISQRRRMDPGMDPRTFRRAAILRVVPWCFFDESRHVCIRRRRQGPSCAPTGRWRPQSESHSRYTRIGTDDTPQLRASYPIIDHRERFIAPHSMAFSADGTRQVVRVLTESLLMPTL